MVNQLWLPLNEDIPDLWPLLAAAAAVSFVFRSVSVGQVALLEADVADDEREKDEDD